MSKEYFSGPAQGQRPDPGNMTLNEVRKKKEELQNKLLIGIQAHVAAFETETGLSVAGIDVDNFDWTSEGGYYGVSNFRVKVRVRE